MLISRLLFMQFGDHEVSAPQHSGSFSYCCHCEASLHRFAPQVEGFIIKSGHLIAFTYNSLVTLRTSAGVEIPRSIFCKASSRSVLMASVPRAYSLIAAAFAPSEIILLS
jgi:hypothetical protein